MNPYDDRDFYFLTLPSKEVIICVDLPHALMEVAKRVLDDASVELRPLQAYRDLASELGSRYFGPKGLQYLVNKQGDYTIEHNSKIVLAKRRGLIHAKHKFVICTFPKHYPKKHFLSQQEFVYHNMKNFLFSTSTPTDRFFRSFLRGRFMMDIRDTDSEDEIISNLLDMGVMEMQLLDYKSKTKEKDLS